MYIYKFTHIDSGRCYIGQTIQLPEQRKAEHLSNSKYSTKEYHFHNALKKYGANAFTFEVIDTAPTLHELNMLEEKYILLYDSINNGFNIRNGGENKLHSDESKRRMSEAQKAAHARRKALGKDGGWKRKDGGPMNGKSSPKKGKESTKWSVEDKLKHKAKMKEIDTCSGKTWKVINGKRVWLTKEAAA